MNTIVPTSPIKVLRAARHHCILPKARAWEKGESGKGKQAVLVLDSLPWQFARVPSLKTSLYAPRDSCPPQPCRPPILLHSKAWPWCPQGICMGQSKIQQSPKSPSTLHRGWQHLGHAKALALCISSALTIQHHLQGQISSRHMAHGEPAASQGHHGSPHHCPPQPGKRKTDLCKGQLMRKLFASRSAGSTGEEQGSSQVARLSDDNKLAQPKHATSSNARLFPLFWENKRGTRPFLARSCPA